MKIPLIMATIFILSGLATTITPVVSPTVPLPTPPSQAEVMTIAPWPGAVWVPGVWVWHPRHQRYVWRHGYWH